MQDLYILKKLALCCMAYTSKFKFVVLFTVGVQVSKKKKRKLPSDVNEGKTVFIRYAFLLQELLYLCRHHRFLFLSSLPPIFFFFFFFFPLALVL